MVHPVNPISFRDNTAEVLYHRILMTFLFNTSFHVNSEVEPEFKAWARQTYIPAIIEAKIFERPVLLKVLTAAPDEDASVTYCIQMFSSRPQEAMAWLDGEAAKIRTVITSRHGHEKVLHFTSAMLVVEDE